MRLVKTLSEFWKLKGIEQAHILCGFIRIYRKGRKPGGKRYPNCTLWDVAAVIKRIGEAHYAREFNAEVLENENAVERSFDLFNDSRYQIFIDTLNDEMQKCADKGLVGGLKKRLVANL